MQRLKMPVTVTGMRKKISLQALLLLSVLHVCNAVKAQAPALWHGIERQVHYKPDGDDFVLVQGRRRFNRALYGGNSAFRVEAGDLPEFALYLPGMGGNLKFGLQNGDSSKWLIEANGIETRYRPGSMLYTITDPLLGKGQLQVTVLALYNGEGMVVKTEGKNVPAGVRLLAVYGGATGQKFSRDGDIGADPESAFYLKPEYCRNNYFILSQNRFRVLFGFKRPLTEEERYEVQHGANPQTTTDDKKISGREITGVFPATANLKLVDAAKQNSSWLLWQSAPSETPAVAATFALENKAAFFLLQNGKTNSQAADVEAIFNEAERTRKTIAGRIRINTPDSFINNLGGALSVAADAIWEAPSYLHGAVAWRMRLNGWRGAYAADVLGWHNRAKEHFRSYAKSQVTEPVDGPVVMDTALHLGRGAEKMGTSFFSSGYISRNPGGDQRPHHYDMNLVFIDQLLNHFRWTGDTAFMKEMWPLVVRHLAWEKRNFDRDGDGLYDAYAAIWASDALQYSGGGVTHSSAYNYRANKAAAELAQLLGEDGTPYRQEAEKIRTAMNNQLWLHGKGWYAEYKDLLGEKGVHPAAGLWTVYHALDGEVPDPFQAFQLMQYVNNEIPHIPIRAKGLMDTTLYTLSTTSWQPYTWSLNNVALAELLHTALAYWQAGRTGEAYRLWKSSLVESMYLGASPGNFQQLSFYDAVRGELYRDFADPIGMAARSLVEGLFGMKPNLLRNELLLQPGFPQQWSHASLITPDIDYAFTRSGKKDRYIINTSFSKAVKLTMRLNAGRAGVVSVTVNGKAAQWRFDSTVIGQPQLQVTAPAAKKFNVEITWADRLLETTAVTTIDGAFSLATQKATLIRYYDPLNALSKAMLTTKKLEGNIVAGEAAKLLFVQLKQGAALYWFPVVLPAQVKTLQPITVDSGNRKYETVNLSSYFNDDVKNIFRHNYVSPRPQTTTLQLPTQGIGNWAYPLTTVTIDDAGLRQKAGEKNEYVTTDGVPFATPSGLKEKNIVFTSQWDNFPVSVTISLAGKAKGAALLMAGSTNPMQSRFTNGELMVRYKDGSSDTLLLRNPENWWPIEQDYDTDGFAFTTGDPKPLRVYLKTGEDTRTFNRFVTIKGFSNRGIDGGAATVLEMPLNPAKELESLTVKAIANDVVIGLMGVTLMR